MIKIDKPLNQQFVNKYDDMILSDAMRELYNGSAFYNVGYWDKPELTLQQAAELLVFKHLDLVTINHKPLSILDVGCGLGATTEVIAQRYPNANITGINISDKQIAYAQQKYPTITFEVMDAAQLSFPDNHFDLIISVEAAFHFSTRKDFLNQAYRVLKPQGELIFTDLLLHDSHWVGNWSIPEENMLTSIESYINLLSSTPFQLDIIKDITANSWMGFCHHLLNQTQMSTLAKGLQKSIIAYLIMRLQK